MVAPKQYKENLGNVIRHKRESMNLSRRELARQTGIPSHDTIRRLELGDYIHYPERETLERLAKHLFEISLREFEDLIVPNEAEAGKSELILGSILMRCEQLSEVKDLSKVIKLCADRITQILEESADS